MKYLATTLLAILISTGISCEKITAQAESAPAQGPNRKITLYGSYAVRSWEKVTDIRKNSEYSDLIDFTSEGKNWTINGTFVIEY